MPFWTFWLLRHYIWLYVMLTYLSGKIQTVIRVKKKQYAFAIWAKCILFQRSESDFFHFFYHFRILCSQNTRPVLFCKLFISIETSNYVFDRVYRVIVGGVFWLFSHSQRKLAFCPIWLQFAYFVLDTFKKSFELDSDTFCFTGKGFNFSPYYSMWKIPYNFNLLPNYLIWPFRPQFRKSLSTNCMP